MSYQQASSANKLDFYNYFVKSLVGGSFMALYDKMIQGNNLYQCLYDGGVFAGSILSINVVKDMFLSQYNNLGGTLGNLLIEPILVMFTYEYIYRNTFAKQYRNIASVKTSQDNYMYAFLFSLLNNYFHNPLLSLLGGIKMSGY